MKNIIIIMFALLLIGCGTTQTVVVKERKVCYGVAAKPKVDNVKVSLEKLETGRYGIVIDDKNFDKILINQLKVDSYIKRSYDIQNRYNTRCKK